MESPRKITLFLIAVTLFAPYFLIEQSLLGGTIIRIVAPLWSFVSYFAAPFAFEFPFGLTIDYLPFWGMGLIIAALAYSSMARNELTKLGYVIVAFIFLLMQLGYFIVIGYITSGGPPISITPIPIVALLALLMAPLIYRSQPSRWEPVSRS
ncbi:MAG: hypothetical protein ACFFEA_01280 [Candidatus Thorarchaeota archaeon]